MTSAEGAKKVFNTGKRRRKRSPELGMDGRKEKVPARKASETSLGKIGTKRGYLASKEGQTVKNFGSQ